MNNLIRKMLLKIAKILGKDISEQTIASLTQFVMFGIVGVTNTIISYVLNILVLAMLQPFEFAWDYVAGNIVAFILSVLWSFYWNNRVVFIQKEGQHRSLWKALLKAYAAYGFTGIVLNNIMSWMWITVFSISKFIAPLINLLISVPLNFVINKLWTFKAD
ncbi:MAG: GtrA family protein [bacterium]|nr:GtrA family protein [bacterium]MCM1374879.1 GtrA family protein [Muribaculum sp.]